MADVSGSEASTNKGEIDYVQEGYWLGQFEKVRRERDKLRAEVDRLTKQNLNLFDERDWLESTAEQQAKDIERLQSRAWFEIPEWPEAHLVHCEDDTYCGMDLPEARKSVIEKQRCPACTRAIEHGACGSLPSESN